jgi:hypothetical protein
MQLGQGSLSLGNSNEIIFSGNASVWYKLNV